MRNIRSWRELKVILKWKFPILSDEDFLMEEHNREGMIAGLTVKLDKNVTNLTLS